MYTRRFFFSQDLPAKTAYTHLYSSPWYSEIDHNIAILILKSSSLMIWLQYL